MTSPPAGFLIADLTVDVRREQVLRGPHEIPLPKLSWEMLRALAQAAPEFVSSDELQKRVWPGLVVSPETVTQRVKLLRRALGDDTRQPRYIEGKRGRGYRFVVPVQSVDVFPLAGSFLPPQQTSTHRSLSRRSALAAAATLGGGAALGLIAFSLGEKRNAGIRSGHPAAQDHYQQALLLREATFSTGVAESALDAVEEQLNRALVLDAEFATAYAERAIVRYSRVFYNIDFGARQLHSAAADLAVANELAPANPKVLAANAIKSWFIDVDVRAALRLFSRAVDNGLDDPLWLAGYAMAAEVAGTTELMVTLMQRAMVLDYENPVLQALYAGLLTRAGRIEEAVSRLDFYCAQRPDVPALQISRAQLHSWLTGDLGPWREAETRRVHAVGIGMNGGVVPDMQLNREFVELRIGGAYGQLLDRVRQFPSSTLRTTYISSGPQPRARLEGWAHLLMGQTEQAKQAGGEVEAFLSSASPLPAHRFFRKLLAAEAALFVGQAEEAVILARELEGMLQDQTLRQWLPVLHAWAGNPSDAARLLRDLAAKPPLLLPGEILLDPLYTQPLQATVEFQVLRAELEERMQGYARLLG